MNISKSESFLLPKHDFRLLVDSAPLFSIDLIVVDAERVLLGQRLNRPAQGAWFVPGGRVRKNETLHDAFTRLTAEELGRRMDYTAAIRLGIFEHFYSDSVFGEFPSTHYIAQGMLITGESTFSYLPAEQHGAFKFWPISEALSDSRVHQYTKDYLRALKIER